MSKAQPEFDFRSVTYNKSKQRNSFCLSLQFQGNLLQEIYIYFANVVFHSISYLSTIMALSIDVVTDPSDFDKIAPMDYIAWQTPYNPQLKHFRPNIPDPEAAIAAQKERSRKAFASHDPSKKWWVKATDTATSEIIGIAIWETNEPKLDANGEAILEKTVARWHPERSEEREFAERFIDGLWGFLAKRVTRPHMDLLSFVVHPKHRKRGAGRMLIRWGTAKADELGMFHPNYLNLALVLRVL